jgi:hypothetical protein
VSASAESSLLLEINVKSHAKARFHDTYDLRLELERPSEQVKSHGHQLAREQVEICLNEGASSGDIFGYAHRHLPPAVDPIHPKGHVRPCVCALVRARFELPFKDGDTTFELLVFLEDTRMRLFKAAEFHLKFMYTLPQILVFSLKNGHGLLPS